MIDGHLGGLGRDRDAVQLLDRRPRLGRRALLLLLRPGSGPPPARTEDDVRRPPRRRFRHAARAELGLASPRTTRAGRHARLKRTINLLMAAEDRVNQGLEADAGGTAAADGIVRDATTPRELCPPGVSRESDEAAKSQDGWVDGLSSLVLTWRRRGASGHMHWAS